MKPYFKHLRTKLLVSMLSVVFLLTVAVLGLVQARMRTHVRQDLVSTLQSESEVYGQIELARRSRDAESAALIADQPTLKALMSTNDRPTIEDASRSILESSGADLLILENERGGLVAFHSKSPDVPISTVKALLPGNWVTGDWWFAGGHLFAVSFAPIVAGAGSELHPLGRIALAREVSPESLAQSQTLANTALIFEQNGHVILSSLPANGWREFETWRARHGTGEAAQEIELGDERYLAQYVQLRGNHAIRLYFLRSYDQATSFISSLNRSLLLLGAFAILSGACIIFIFSRQITRPLEHLVSGTRHLEHGDFEFQVPVTGHDEVAELAHAFEHMRDTLRQSREGMLRSARLEAVGRLAGGVAHDFNNLVMIIKGYSDLLLDSATPESRSYIDEIKSAGERAAGLTRQLLAFSRKQVLEPQVLDPNQTVRNMVKMLRVLIGEDIELITNLSDQTIRMLADPGQIEQVIMNLAVNARDAMPTGGKLVIETKPCHLDEAAVPASNETASGSFILMSIMDTGTGMSPETLAHIFEPFFTTKEAGKGTGLGLATVYGIVKQSRGYVFVDSEIGRGTTFKVYFPSLDKATPMPAPQPSAMPVRGQGTILLVEDEAALRALAVESLRRLGYKVLPANDGIEALSVADQHPEKIDVVITDVVMPRMGGPEFVEKLRQKRGPIATIFMSGYTDAAALENAKIGSDAILLNKPFSTELLASKVNELQQRQAQSDPVGNTRTFAASSGAS